MPRTPRQTSFSTEASIKKVAHKIFLAKGFSATTVRMIAKEARVNVALVSYYFNGKKNLFNVVMSEKAQELLSNIVPIVNNESSSLDEKIEKMVQSYIDFLIKNPELPSFIFNELRMNKFKFISNTGLKKNVHKSYFMEQLEKECGDINPKHFLITLVGMIGFPFVCKPAMLQVGLVNEKGFLKMMEERKKLIPSWINAMLKD